MASLDFLYDMADSLNKEGFNYVIFALKRGKRNKHKSDVLYKIDNKKNYKMLKSSIAAFEQAVES